jgi:hypothetical protein
MKDVGRRRDRHSNQDSIAKGILYAHTGPSEEQTRTGPAMIYKSSAHLSHPVPADGQSDPDATALKDWNRLLMAVIAKLRSSVGEPCDESCTARTKAARQIQGVVLGCAMDLDLLHTALGAESARRRRFEAGFAEANAALMTW